MDEALLANARKTVAARVKELRDERKMSQTEAALAAGVPQFKWSRVESGEHEPRLTMLLQIQHALGLPSIECLLGEVNLPSTRLLTRETSPASGAKPIADPPSAAT